MADFRVLKMPDPAFNVDRMKGKHWTGILSSRDRASLSGTGFVVVNEILKRGEKSMAWAMITLESDGEVESFGALPKTKKDGIDPISTREFSERRGPFFVYRFEPVEIFEKPIELRRSPAGRRYTGKIPTSWIEKADFIEEPKGDLAIVHPSGNVLGDEVDLREFLRHIKSFKIRRPFLTLVGGLANHGKTRGDFDIVFHGPVSEEVRRVVEFRLGRCLPGELAKRLSIHDDVFGAPFTDYVDLADLVVEVKPVFELKRMRSQDDPFLDMPKDSGKRRAVFQFHFRGESVHGDLRFQIDDWLIGWTLAIQKPGAIKSPVERDGEAKKYAASWKRDGNQWFKSLMAPGGIFATKKERQDVEWLSVHGETEAFGTTNFPAIFAIVDKPSVEYGVQEPTFHEYFLSGDGPLTGQVFVRQIPGGGGQAEIDVEDGRRTPAGKTFWKMMISKDPFPTILKKRSVDKKRMPPDGFSWLPRSLARSIPTEYRYWMHNGEKAREIRDALVASNFLSPAKVKEVGGEIVFVDNAGKAAVPLECRAEELYESILAKADRGRFRLVWQYWKGQQVSRVGPTSERWALVVRRDGSLHAWSFEVDPLSGEEKISGLPIENPDTSLWDLSGDVKPGTKWNPEKATSSFARLIDQGDVEFGEEAGEALSLRFTGKRLRGTFLLQPESKGAPIWVLTHKKTNPPMETTEVVKVSDDVANALLEDPPRSTENEETLRVSRNEFAPLVRFQPMKPVEGSRTVFFEVPKALDSFVDEAIKAGEKISVEPKWNGIRTIIERNGDDVLIFFEDTKDDRSRVFPSVVEEVKKVLPSRVIVDGELQWTIDGVPQPRRTLSRFTGPIRPENVDDTGVDFEIFDVLHVDGKSLLDTPYRERREILRGLFSGDHPHFKISPIEWASTREGVESHADKMAKVPGSEGFLLKMSDSIYTLGGRTDSWAKVKLARVVRAVVLDRILKKKPPQQRSPAKTWVYLCGVGPITDASKFREVRHVDGKDWAVIGKTGASNIEAKVGDILEVETLELNIDERGDRGMHLRWFGPAQAVDVVSGNPTTVDELRQIAKPDEIQKDGDVPPKEVQEAAALGLELRREFGRGGTEIGVARARDLSNGRQVSKDTLRRMRSYFARHAVDAKAEGWEDRKNPSAGWVAWLLWGGDPGRDWAGRILAGKRDYPQGIISEGDVGCRIIKRDDDERTILGIVLEPEEVDTQGDIASEDEIRATAWTWMEKYQNLGIMHERVDNIGIRPLESYLAPVEFEIKNGDQSERVKKGTWLLRVRVVDGKLWERVKSGELNGFSMGGSAIRKPEK